VPKESQCRAAAATPYRRPCVRNTFVIERANPQDRYGDSDEVHYGQDVVLKVIAYCMFTMILKVLEDMR